MEFTLLFAALTGIGAAWIANLIRRRSITVERPTDTLVVTAAGGLAAGRVVAMILDGVNPLTHPGDLIIVRAGVHTGAAALAALLTLGWLARRHLPAALDQLAPAALAGLAGWHAGCLWRNGCLGAASDLPWAFAQPGSDITRHPVELYAALALLVGAVSVARLARPWLAASAALAVASGVRLVTESLRPSLSGGPVGWYLAGLAVGFGAVILAALGRMPRSRTVGHLQGPGDPG